MLPTNKTISEKLQQRKEKNAFRTLTTTHNIIDFCSNDYLGFSKSLDFKDKYLAYQKNFNNMYYMGATGSRLISGNTALIESLEKYLSDYHQAESGLIFNSGYDANLGLLSCLPQRGDTIYYDAHVHASIRDGIRLSFAKAYSFKHNNIEDLRNKIKHASGQIYIIAESVYSMDGDCAPLKELVDLCTENNAFLVLDEAHATGVFGRNGKGLADELNLTSKIFARIHTFGKALGCHGAIILGSEDLRSFLINFSRPFIYTTALPFHSFIAIKSAYDMLSEDDTLLPQLHENISLFKKLINPFISSLKEARYVESISAIQCFIVEGNDNVKKIATHLNSKGFDIKPILSPTVAKGQERIRICIHSFNTDDEIKSLAKSLSEILS